jgi:hypothetical protein
MAEIIPEGITLTDVSVTEKQLLDMHVEARDHPARLSFLEKREKYWRLYRGEVILSEKLDSRPKDADFYAKENKIHEGVETIVAFQTKNNPRFWCAARKADLEHLATQMNGFLRYDYECYIGMRVTLQEWVRAKSICGASPVKISWDSSRQEDFKEGVNRVEVVSWDDFMPYPYGQDVHNIPYVIHRTRKTYNDVCNDRNYGEQAEKVLGKRGSRGRLGRGYDKIKEVISVTDVTPAGRELIDVYEYWIRPYAMVELEGDNGKTRRIPKYPGGIVITVINGKAVWVRENQFDHKRFPFVVMYCYRNKDTADDPELRGSFYDFMGEVEQAASPQANLDMISQALLTNARILSNTPIVTDDTFLNVPITSHQWKGGEIIRTSDVDRAVRVPQMPIIPPHAAQYAVAQAKAVFDSMGISDYMLGNKPAGLSHTAGLAVGLAQEAGFGRTHPKTNLLDQAMMEVGAILVSNNRQFRRPGTYLAFTNEGIKEHQEWTQEHKTTEFTVQVEHGSTTPANDIDRVQHAAQLYQMALPIFSLPVEQIPPHLLDLLSWLVRTAKLQGTQSLLQLITEIKEGQATIQQLQQVLQQTGGMEGEMSPETPEASPEMGITEGEMQ